jgi:formylmethanofuran dehydrogenase subunit E
MNIGPYTFEAFLQRAVEFHGHAAPGLILGGYMVEEARRHLPENTIFDALSETSKCLPDSIQLLTPCSFGNGWLKIADLGRFALALYDKHTGEGVRVYLEPAKLSNWPEIKAWLFKLKPKKEQDLNLLLQEIRQAGSTICGIERVQLNGNITGPKHSPGIVVCPVCREAYPEPDGGICRACQGESPYKANGKPKNPGPDLKAVPVEQAVGQALLHDVTEIIRHRSKAAAFQEGQLVTAGDICRLQRSGNSRVYLKEINAPGEEWLHENEAALGFARLMAGDGMEFTEPPREGKITFFAGRTGLFVLQRKILERFNLIPEVMCACRQNYLVVAKGEPLAACRSVPLYLSREYFNKARGILAQGPLFQILPLRQARVALLVTGNEVFNGLVEDKFIPLIKAKVEQFGGSLVGADILPDDRQVIAQNVGKLLSCGADLLITTAGLSVDPNDVTRQGLLDAGLEDFLYGAPIVPGAMILIGRIGAIQVLGVPACGLYHQTTSLDLLLPRLLAGMKISRLDLAQMAEGSFCLLCDICTFPKCPPLASNA